MFCAAQQCRQHGVHGGGRRRGEIVGTFLLPRGKILSSGRSGGISGTLDDPVAAGSKKTQTGPHVRFLLLTRNHPGATEFLLLQRLTDPASKSFDPFIIWIHFPSFFNLTLT